MGRLQVSGSPSQFLSGFYALNDDGVFVREGAVVPVNNYSDGDRTENRLMSVVRSAKDRSVFSRELRDAMKDWPSTYHLSPARANLLRPFGGWLADKNILELGAGCGAVTRYLGEVTAEGGGNVVAVEGSSRRAAIARARTDDLSNVQVVAEDLLGIESKAQFDAVVVVGVLEYARLAGLPGETGATTFLRHIKKFLKPDGVLFLAIENQLGLKYLAGDKEDHLGIPWFGVNDLYSADTAVTYGHAELCRHFSDAGFEAVRTWLPFPDYKMPTLMLAPEAMHHADFRPGFLIAETNGCEQRPVFSPQRAWPVLERNGLLPEMANSFLMVAGQAENLADSSVLAWHFSTGRARPFVRETRFAAIEGEGVMVSRHALGREKARATEAGYVWAAGEEEREAYIARPSWWFSMLDIVSRDGWTLEQLTGWATVWIEAWLARAGVECLENGLRVHGDMVDATPFNMIVAEDGRTATFFDLEWSSSKPVAADFLLVRALREALRKVALLAPPADRSLSTADRIVTRVLAHFGLHLTQEDLDRCSAEEAVFQAWVNDEPHSLNIAERIRYNDFPLRWYEPQSDPVGMSADTRLALEVRIVEMQKAAQERQAELNTMEQRVHQAEAELERVRTSLVWRAGSILRKFDAYCPRLTGGLRRLRRG
jgi:SAM-dependent methyltransferase